MELKKIISDIKQLEYYCRELDQSFPISTYVIGNHETGKFLKKSLTDVVTIGKAFYVQSFNRDIVDNILIKHFNKIDGSKIYHNFTWYKRRLEFLKNKLNEK
jgi:hypothetical protein